MNDAESGRNALVAGLGTSLVAGAATMFAGLTLVFAACISLTLVLSIALGASKHGTPGPYRWYLVAALAIWLVAFAGMHVLSASTGSLVLGFPPATAMAIYILWLLPFFVVTLPYALHFESFTLTDEDWRRLEPYARQDRDTP